MQTNNKLREAAEKTKATLEKALQILNGISDEEAGRLNARLEDVADAICKVTQWIIPDALAEPVRNCDVIGNTGRALAVHGFTTKSKPWGEGEWLKLIDWLFAPYKEGGAK